jgi:hypothetical protein
LQGHEQLRMRRLNVLLHSMGLFLLQLFCSLP